MPARRGDETIENPARSAPNEAPGSSPIRGARPRLKAVESGQRAAGSDVRDVSRQIFWNMVSTNKYLEDMLRSWARQLGLSGTHGLILMAIVELDQGAGVSVRAVSARLQVGATFVTVQTKHLERLGFVERVRSNTDARIVLISLAAGRKSEITELLERWDAIHEFIFSDFAASTWRDVRDKLDILRKRYEIARTRVMDQYIADPSPSDRAEQM
jgi:MarR family transcriptional regulator, organic hydroperoxide resistance regulator